MKAVGDSHGVRELERRRDRALSMGGDRRVEKQHNKGRMSARERIRALVDRDSFHETGLFAHSEREEVRHETPADGKITGFAEVLRRSVFVTADDATVMAGAGGAVGMRKAWKAKKYAIGKGLPIINLGDAGGARLPDILGSVGLMSTAWPVDHAPRDRRVPMIAAIMGECFGLPSWSAATADVVVQVKGSVYAVGGASIIGVATGESVSNEELGGWKVHAYQTGAVDLFADDDQECLALIRRVLSYFPDSFRKLPPVIARPRAPGARGDEVLSVVPSDRRQGYDMHDLLALLVDEDSLLELKPHYDGSLITALARLDGHVVGILANNPAVTAGAMGFGACEKAASFISLCDSFHIPLLFLHDTPGFMLSREAEAHKMPIQIMRFIDALHHCSVPRISLILRKSYGMAHFNMSGAQMVNDQLLAWPDAEISFMAPEVALNVMYGRQLANSDDPERLQAELLATLQEGAGPWEPAGLNLIDQVIDPRDTREVLIQSFRLARGADGEGCRSQRHMAAWPKIC